MESKNWLKRGETKSLLCCLDVDIQPQNFEFRWLIIWNYNWTQYQALFTILATPNLQYRSISLRIAWIATTPDASCLHPSKMCRTAYPCYLGCSTTPDAPPPSTLLYPNAQPWCACTADAPPPRHYSIPDVLLRRNAPSSLWSVPSAPLSLSCA